jgi:hypothetical protein
MGVHYEPQDHAPKVPMGDRRSAGSVRAHSLGGIRGGSDAADAATRTEQRSTSLGRGAVRRADRSAVRHIGVGSDD